MILDVSSMVPKPGANREVNTGSLTNTSIIVQHPLIVGKANSTLLSTRHPTETRPGGSARVSPTPSISEMDRDKYGGDGDVNIQYKLGLLFVTPQHGYRKLGQLRQEPDPSNEWGPRV